MALAATASAFPPPRRSYSYPMFNSFNTSNEACLERKSLIEMTFPRRHAVCSPAVRFGWLAVRG
jgi:hypothetical protein